ncbi:MAG: trypsin-like peptidase domain-containing protein, partial [Victivallales bacterium]|nr:trypsin-like peptidase domain-containing protein [Victivallales bacterium]
MTDNTTNIMNLMLAFILLPLCALLNAEPSTVRMTPAVKAANRALPWVVSIGTEINVRVNDPYIVKLNDYFSTYFMKPRKVREYTPLGSGIIIHSSGLVLTNWHVTRAADTILLRMYNGQSVPARVVGYDTQSDLCLLQASGDFTKAPLAQATLGMPDDLLLGETVLTLGNPYGLEHSVSQGVLSAINRALGVTGEPYNDMLQTDAAINPGNSGGPLINLDGDVIGINQAIRSDAQGIGFAIPAKRLEAFLAAWLMPETFGHSWFGIIGANMTQEGVRVRTSEGSPASTRLSEGTVITEVNGRPISRILDLSQALWQLRQGDKAQFTLNDGRQVELTVGVMPPSVLIMRRLGFRVQKLTKRMNQAMGLPESLKGLAIS